MWNSTDRGRCPSFTVGQNVLLPIRKVALHHPSLRNKFAKRWLGPCRVLRLVGNTAAQIQLPSTLKALNIHDVFHFSVLKPYHESFQQQTDSDPVPAPQTALTPVFEVECITDYDKAHALSDDTGTKCPHYRVHWRGYPSSEDTWLPLTELSTCLEAVADYLFTVASPTRRIKLIAEFPKRSRDKLAHLLARAARTCEWYHPHQQLLHHPYFVPPHSMHPEQSQLGTPDSRCFASGQGPFRLPELR